MTNVFDCESRMLGEAGEMKYYHLELEWEYRSDQPFLEINTAAPRCKYLDLFAEHALTSLEGSELA